MDETGLVKAGAKSCGVGRPYRGTAGRVENGPVGVFVGHMAPKGRALVDRAHACRTTRRPTPTAGGTPGCRRGG